MHSSVALYRRSSTCSAHRDVEEEEEEATEGKRSEEYLIRICHAIENKNCLRIFLLELVVKITPLHKTIYQRMATEHYNPNE